MNNILKKFGFPNLNELFDEENFYIVAASIFYLFALIGLIIATFALVVRWNLPDATGMRAYILSVTYVMAFNYFYKAKDEV